MGTGGTEIRSGVKGGGESSGVGAGNIRDGGGVDIGGEVEGCDVLLLVVTATEAVGVVRFILLVTKSMIPSPSASVKIVVRVNGISARGWRGVELMGDIVVAVGGGLISARLSTSSPTP